MTHLCDVMLNNDNAPHAYIRRLREITATRINGARGKSLESNPVAGTHVRRRMMKYELLSKHESPGREGARETEDAFVPPPPPPPFRE